MNYQDEYYLRFGFHPNIPVMVRPRVVTVHQPGHYGYEDKELILEPVSVLGQPEKTCITNEEIAEVNKLTLNNIVTMNRNELKIEVPQGMVIDTENSNLANGIIKFKPKEKQLPKTWDEFCETYPITENEYFIKGGSEIQHFVEKIHEDRSPDRDKNVGTKETCEAVLALMQLIQLRDCYNDGWTPDWSDGDSKYTICIGYGCTKKNINVNEQHVLAFKTAELRDQFLENFRDLIETAKPLI